ncbi:serine hydrolase [Arcicella rigui]|uniref:Serine hydrolase n=1 Tax=Arcicella rigui TaxID=797020 RepID=A0ABU5QC50_9BACT|nr:serine hydrolase [Arcicella rigui]MEA5140434.1 serine hydrolase [Arcicella rigui]
MTNRFFTSFLCCLLTSCVLVAQKKELTKKPLSDAQLATLFDGYIQNSLSLWKTPGLSVVVVKDGNVVLKKAYGVKNNTTKEPYTTATLSTCASTTKAMTALCLGILVDEGKVKWNDRVIDILPEFRLSNPNTTAEIRVKDLLTHNAGLGNADLLWVLGYSSSEILQRMQYIPMAYSLRSSFIYQNVMYLVAGEVIKKVSGKTWSEFITEKIFTPLKMTNTYADYSKIPATASKTSPHYKDKALADSIRAIGYLDGDVVGPAGGVWSCGDDISKWLQFLQDSTKIEGKAILKAQTFSELFKPQSFVTASEFYPTARLTKPHWTTYGLGWFQQDYRGKMVQFHTGSLDGLVAIAGTIPDERISIYVFGNLDHSEIRHALLFKAFDLWSFQDNTKDWSNDFFQLYKGIIDNARKKENEELAKRVINTRPSLPLTAYTGKYENEVYGSLEVILKNDILVLTQPNNISFSLEHWHYDTFLGQSNNWWWGKSGVQFSLDFEGKSGSLSLDGIPFRKVN